MVSRLGGCDVFPPVCGIPAYRRHVHYRPPNPPFPERNSYQLGPCKRDYATIAPRIRLRSLSGVKTISPLMAGSPGHDTFAVSHVSNKTPDCSPLLLTLQLPCSLYCDMTVMSKQTALAFQTSSNILPLENLLSSRGFYAVAAIVVLISFLIVSHTAWPLP